MKLRKLLLLLVLAAFTLSIGLPLAEAAPAKPRLAHVAKGKAQKKKQKRQKKRQKKRQQKRKQRRQNRRHRTG